MFFVQNFGAKIYKTVLTRKTLMKLTAVIENYKAKV